MIATDKVKEVEDKEERGEENFSHEHTKMIFPSKDVLKASFKVAKSTSFKVSDTEKLRLFYCKRLAKKVLEIITPVWHKRRKEQCIDYID